MNTANGFRGNPLVVFAGGGTGGHLFPALALAEALRELWGGVRFEFLATDRSIDRRVLRDAECGYVPQSLPPMSRRPWRLARALFGIHRANRDCRARFRENIPAAVIGTGGLASLPAVREAHRAGIPTALLNPDVLPGRANRRLTRSADVIFAQWVDSVEFLPPTARVVVHGCPVRRGFGRVDRNAGIQRFGLHPERKTLLVTGASQGARSINEAIIANIDYLETLEGWQVLHLTGDADHERVQEVYRGRDVESRLIAFSDHMPDALAAADLVVARAGASFLAELTAAGRASILMPYPHHRDHHQLANARCLERASAARIVRDQSDPARNGPAVRKFLDEMIHDDQCRESMAASAKRIGRVDAAERIAQEIVALIRSRRDVVGIESVELPCGTTRYR